MSYPGDFTFAFKQPIGSADEPEGLECKDAARQYRLVTKTDHGVAAPDGGTFLRVEAGVGDNDGGSTGYRVLFRLEFPKWGGKNPGYVEHEGDDVWYFIRTLYDQDWAPNDNWCTIEGHCTAAAPGQLTHTGNWGLRDYGDLTTGVGISAGPVDAAGQLIANAVGGATKETLPRGAWYDRIIHVLNHGKIGVLEIFGGPNFDSLYRYEGPTLQVFPDGSPDSSYSAFGIYLPTSITKTAVSYWDTAGRRSSFAAAKAALGSPSAPPPPPPPPPPSPKPVPPHPLDVALAELVATAYYKTWAKANTGERLLLQKFAAGSEVVPKLSTHEGRMVVQMILARVPAGLPATTVTL